MFKPEDIEQYKKIEARPQLKQRILTEHQARTEASPRLPHSRPRPVFAGVAAFAVICILIFSWSLSRPDLIELSLNGQLVDQSAAVELHLATRVVTFGDQERLNINFKLDSRHSSRVRVSDGEIGLAEGNETAESMVVHGEADLIWCIVSDTSKVYELEVSGRNLTRIYELRFDESKLTWSLTETANP